MKILQLNTYSDSSVGGGAERTMEELAAALKKSGHTISVIGTSKENIERRYLKNSMTRLSVGLKNIYWPHPNKRQPILARRLWHLVDIYNLAMRSRLGKILDREKPDIVIMHNLSGWSISAISACRTRKIPILQVLHDYYNICVNSMMFENEKNCVRQCMTCRIMRAPHRMLTNGVNAVVGVSEFTLDRHVMRGAFRKVPIKRVILNARSAKTLGLNEAQTLKQNSRLDRKEIDIRFGFIGTLAPNKGIEYLLTEFRKLDNPRAEIWIAGGAKPDYLNMLKAKFEGEGIKFLGQMEQKDFFSAIDVTVVPSLWHEPLGMVVAESLAFGIPVLGAHRGGIPEMVIDGETGWIFEPDHPGSLLSLLRRCIEAPEKIKKMGDCAQSTAKRFLDIDGWSLAYLNVIDEILEAHKKSIFEAAE